MPCSSLALRASRTASLQHHHISFLDILVLNARLPLRFVAKREVSRWPVVGWLSARTGTVFLERGSARAARSSL
ncbi:MAG: 1-acyl-sn-glycerol-3-phosphate acyltransferase [Rhodoferax sp.]|nr:1-acyl-sn-glycerol-3-phosphate acyltransferase [Rhodoferax sp.]